MKKHKFIFHLNFADEVVFQSIDTDDQNIGEANAPKFAHNMRIQTRTFRDTLRTALAFKQFYIRITGDNKLKMEFNNSKNGFIDSFTRTQKG